MAEGFSGVMRNVVELNLFEGFEFRSNGLVVSHLQYADDTLCIGKPTVDNLWTMKVVLRGFEMASGLKINFFKSCLIGVNVPNDFMEMACNFLNCSEGSLPFKYLGLPVGANPRSFGTWEPLVEHLSRRLNTWGHKYISLGGRIILLNSVLNAKPIFYLPFLRMSANVWRRIVRIQREFLWGGVGGGRKISWVNWNSVCQAKENSGLGLRDVRVLNVSLLAKWKWRLLDGETGLWKPVLVKRYGPNVTTLVEGAVAHHWRSASTWWRDVVNLDNFGAQGWFSSELTTMVDNGMNSSLWNVKWRGDRTFRSKYPRLYSISNQKECCVGEIGEVVGSSTDWHFEWRRDFFDWED